ncbi:MAG: SoxY-related AACIE arm protein [Rhodocyclaceae bacterium]|nr:SoxY-related AACIE arm protein [Rhodocyclaceae bacterium]MCA3021327.1 SoxY-related AACIE arm protein [Rhodocyclaceae bacterium]MCA3025818.1 SoxY-related AACIE arm protein [Rhodocyclaceae bacterium]MCA3032613.1 SoxY-related AACIE arm protein [Rhodocyclaceae bacterium]MCA3036357.1 SoxY-related AACIE arm protein [Rhodocyclaceae bacterium]
MTPRRVFLTQVSTLGAATILLRSVAALADNDALVALTRAYAGGGPVREGRVTLEIAPLVDNGNSVPITVSVLSPMTAADRVVGIAVFNEKNPQPEVAEFTLGPRAGRAKIATRIRLATTQKLVAVAKMSDGSCWTHTVEVVVTLAACLED